MGFYGNLIITEKNEFVKGNILLESFKMSKEEILKNPKKAAEILKHESETGNDVSKIVAMCLYLLSLFILAGIPTMFGVIMFAITSISGLIIDLFGPHTKLLCDYSEYKRNADKLRKDINSYIEKIDKEIKKSNDQKYINHLKKEKHELEKILNHVKYYQTEEEYYKSLGCNASAVKYYKQDIKSCLKCVQAKEYIFDSDGGFFNFFPLWYFNVSESEFDKFMRTFKDTDGNNWIHDIFDEHEMDKDLVELAKNDHPIEVSSDGSGDSVYYFRSVKKFLFYDHEAADSKMSDLLSYSEMINATKNDSKKDVDFVRADAELGYYRLSEPPKGVERKPFV